MIDGLSKVTKRIMFPCCSLGFLRRPAKDNPMRSGAMNKRPVINSDECYAGTNEA